MRGVLVLLLALTALAAAVGVTAALVAAGSAGGFQVIIGTWKASLAPPAWRAIGYVGAASAALALLLSAGVALWPSRASRAPRFSALREGDLTSAIGEVRQRLAACASPQTPHIIQLLEELIRGAVSLSASDVHITPSLSGARLTYRVHGSLYPVTEIDVSLAPLLVTRIKVLARLDVFMRGVPQDGRLVLELDGGSVEARVSTLPTETGERVVLRLVRGSRAVPTLDSLGFTEGLVATLGDLLAKPQGLLFVTGPVGSGKTTTLYSALQRIAKHRGQTTALVTLEDPIELELPFATQTQMNPKTGMTFATTLRSVLRQDPNVLMIGEIRDRETADIAMQAGLTGHLILTTVHGQSAAGVFARVIEMGVEPFALASATLGCLSQRLVRTLCTACRREANPEPLLVDRLARRGIELQPTGYYEPVGCPICDHQGFAVRIPIAELLTAGSGVRQAIHRRATSAEIHEAAVDEGMAPLLQSGVELAGRGVTSLAEVLRVAG